MKTVFLFLSLVLAALPGCHREGARGRAPPAMPAAPAARFVDGPAGMRVDIGPTLERIRRGQRRAHHNDGAVFLNLEGRLPARASGYYHEYVHPTEGVDGPGAQRVILGAKDEVYYTPDHYQTFQRVTER
ncbi:MAG: ribonuclease domain-containing protein [Planctomycetota bacterium]